MIKRILFRFVCVGIAFASPLIPSNAYAAGEIDVRCDLADSSAISYGVSAGFYVYIERSGEDVLVGGEFCGTVDTIEQITVKAPRSAKSFYVSVFLGNGPLGPGGSTETGGISEIEIDISPSEWSYGVIDIYATDADEEIVVGQAGADLNGDGDADLTSPGSILFRAQLGPGDDQFSGQGGPSLGGPAEWTLGAVGDEGNDTLTGGMGYDILEGTGGDDLLDGATGGDVLVGGEGHDQLLGGSGDDTLDPGAGIDTLTPGLGNDAIAYGSSTGPVRIDLQTQTVDGGSATGDVIVRGYYSMTGFEDAIGSEFDDEIYGTSGINSLSGLSGNDLIVGSGGNDRLFGWYGDDMLQAGRGQDVIKGYEGDDVLDGGPGIDRTFGGAGSDSCSRDEDRDKNRACESETL